MEQKELEELRCFLFVSIISADNDEYPEDKKQEVMRRYELEKTQEEPNWEFVLEPVDNNGKLLKLFI